MARTNPARKPADPKELPERGEARRQFLVEARALTTGIAASPYLHDAAAATRAPARPGAARSGETRVRMTVNGRAHELELDPRVTLLDALREHLRVTSAKKGCDRGQCGACTVLVNGRRINSCLTLALSHEGDEVVTAEGLGTARALHPVQRAFVERDAYQCGYCTPGQVCSGAALIAEARAGAASAATADVRRLGPAELGDGEIRERMSGNLCRCGAYVNIVAAIRDAAKAS